ncbi:DNA polymerase [Methylomarinovum caldicuralii]|uniref:DNA polymerase beta n=1 Tax=Methylomarinovum caldicuralii TaxID=438856 RepID=A0AAU9CQT8_9GAMM|nr:DNA polymerase/3'-5' exonuclease PolX [Methylomarinovum caldicuralii]BCX81882.1 DNA polymerase [Methylomarinovum caldicuralii]
MALSNSEIADLFDELADLLDIEGENPYKVRAYRNAARSIRSLPRSLAEMVAAGEDLTRLPGIGERIARKIETVVKTGKLPQLEQALARTPPTLLQLLRIEGLGPKRVKALFSALNIRTLEDLERAARSGRIRRLPGFGPKIEALILKHLDQALEGERRYLRFEAEDIATALIAHLRQAPGVDRIEVAGSYRRWKETVGDLDILVTVQGDSPVMDRFVTYEGVAEVLSHGGTRSSIRLRNGMQVDLRVVASESFGAALQYFTGSKAHNIEIRTLAVKQGLKINEYGVFRGEKRLAGEAERDVYACLGLAYIVPELREGRGEVEAALENRLPKLVELADIRGDLHAHTKDTDGRDDLETMAQAAKALGYEYLAITDHSRRVTVARGLDEKHLRAQMEAIDALNERLEGITLLKGIEVDILEDGTLDLPDSVLKDLDLRVCSVHYQFNLSKPKQTERILRAMDNPYFNILAHPTGRLINKRRPYAIDLPRIMAAAKERGCLLEINAQPERLDLNDEHCLMARDLGVGLVISTDAHTAAGLQLMRYGVAQARRGWLEKTQIVNTLPLAQLKQVLTRP